MKYATLPKGLSGWHHLGLTSDGHATRAFLDGVLQGEAAEVVSTGLLTIGTHPEQQHQHWMMCAGLRQQYLFHAALTAAEITKVMRLSEH